MSVSVYTYPVSATATNAVNPAQLHAEVETDSSVYAVCLGVTIIDGATISFEFDAVLGATEQSALAVTVSQHTPIVVPDSVTLTDQNVIFDSQGRLLFDSQGRLGVTR